MTSYTSSDNTIVVALYSRSSMGFVRYRCVWKACEFNSIMPNPAEVAIRSDRSSREDLK